VKSAPENQEYDGEGEARLENETREVGSITLSLQNSALGI
jgi:hypothetical protein